MATRITATATTVIFAFSAIGHASDSPRPCPNIPEATCGLHRVPEDRAAPGGRVLDLDYVVFPARLDELAPPLFFLLGGPGESATSIAPYVMRSPLADVLDHRALVLLDQRGTGGSHLLQCDAPAEPAGHFGALFDPEDVRRCRNELATKADLRFYTTTIAVEDLDALRSRLGYERIALWGGSYGTRVAMEYIRRHGERVERAVLDAVSGLDGRMPLFFAYDAQHAFDRVAADCAADPACAAAYPDLEGDLAAVIDRLREGPAGVEIRTENDGPPVEVPFSLGDFGYSIRGMLYSSDQTASLPGFLHVAATAGNLRPFAQAYYRRSASLGDGLANGMYLSVVCSEDVPFITDDLAFRWTAGTFLGDYLIHEYRRACDLWDRGEIPADYHRPVRSDVPVLVLSGARDPSTPPRWGERAVRGLSNARHVVFPFGGHGNGDTPCGAEIIRAFLAGAEPSSLAASCVDAAVQQTAFRTPHGAGSRQEHADGRP